MVARWKDIPITMLEKRLAEADHLRALFRIAADRVNNLSARIGRQVQAGEPLGELDVMNELHVIAVALANAGGVDVGWAFDGDAVDLEIATVTPDDFLSKIRALLIEHLGSENAADVWLNSTKTGYPTTAMDVIRAGKGDFVLDDLENQWGPGPHYA